MTKPTGLIFLGPPGSGKGTQAQILGQSLQIPHISTGEILREAITQETELGQKAQSYVEQGELVPDELLLNLIEERLGEDDAQKGWILDGFPRNVGQAVFLEQLLGRINQFDHFVISLEVPKEMLLRRLLGRGRKDDTQETINHRLEVYQNQTAPLINFYQQKGKLKSIDGSLTPEEVTASIKQVLGS